MARTKEFSTGSVEISYFPLKEHKKRCMIDSAFPLFLEFGHKILIFVTLDCLSQTSHNCRAYKMANT